MLAALASILQPNIDIIQVIYIRKVKNWSNSRVYRFSIFHREMRRRSEFYFAILWSEFFISKEDWENSRYSQNWQTP